MDSFEDYLKKEAAGFRMEPSDKVWKGVQSGLQQKKRRKAIVYSVAASVIILLLAGLFFIPGTSPAPVSSDRSNNNNDKVNTPSVQPPVANTAPEAKTTAPVTSSATLLHTNKGTGNNNPPTPVAPLTDKKDQFVLLTTLDPLFMFQVPVHEGGFLSKYIIFDRLPVQPYTVDATQAPDIKEKTRMPDTRFFITGGTNITHSLHSGIQAHFIKPDAGINIMAGVNHTVFTRVQVSAAVSYQYTRYRLGVASITPEPFTISQKATPIQASYRLTNESFALNHTHRVGIPLLASYTLFNLPASKMSAFGGIEPSVVFTGKYLIGVPGSDRVFNNSSYVRPLNAYYEAGLSYSRKISAHQAFLISYTLQRQALNNFIGGLDIKEHLLHQVLSAGIAF